MTVKGKNAEVVGELMKVDPFQVIMVDTKGNTIFHMMSWSGRDQVLLELDQFLNELILMFEHNSEKGSVWVTLKSSSLTSKVKRDKKLTFFRATDGKKIISTTETYQSNLAQKKRKNAERREENGFLER